MTGQVPFPPVPRVGCGLGRNGIFGTIRFLRFLGETMPAFRAEFFYLESGLSARFWGEPGPAGSR